jgi:hypothetical protein
MRARPDIRPAVRNAGIKPKPRAFTDIDALKHYTFTPQMRAHPDIGPSRISKINGLARAAEAGACKKCRVTGKYYVPDTHKLHRQYYVPDTHKLHRHAPQLLLRASCEATDCTHNPAVIIVIIIIIGVEHRKTYAAAKKEKDIDIDIDMESDITTALGGPAINEEHRD